MLSCIQPLPTLHFLCIIREHLACDCLPQSPSCLAEAMQRGSCLQACAGQQPLRTSF
uniref:Family with sequence similarity 47, member E n=1 Tax=Mus spicilegus TaxID=10103 RepID=A0A8C6HKG4_MUSSI